MHNFRLQKLIDDIIIDFHSFENFVSIKDIKWKYNPIVNLSKFISNKKILSEIVALNYNKICSQILSIRLIQSVM